MEQRTIVILFNHEGSQTVSYELHLRRSELWLLSVGESKLCFLQGTSMPINIPLMSRNPFNAIDRGDDDGAAGKFIPPHLLEQVC